MMKSILLLTTVIAIFFTCSWTGYSTGSNGRAQVSVVPTPVTRVWAGGANTNWSNGGSWVGGFAPFATDTAKFDNTAASDCYIDGNKTCAAVIINGFTHNLEIGNGNTFTVNGSFTQTGASSAVFFQGSTGGVLALTGNLTRNSGSFNTNLSEIQFNVNTGDTIKGITTFHDLTINANGDFTMLANTTINGTLKMNTGRIDMNGDTLTVNTSGAPSGYVDGAIAHTFSSASTFEYPLGSVSGATGPGYVTVSVTTATFPVTLVAQTRGFTSPPVYDNNRCVSHGWMFNQTSGSITAADLTFDYSNMSHPGAEASYVLGRNDGTTYQPQASNAPNTTNHTISINGISPSSSWAIGEPTALPIVLSQFTASAAEGKNVTLDWSTTSETNTLGFYVQRRDETGSEYTTVSGLISGAGNSLEEHHYTFTDITASPGTYTYRLKQVDLDGSVTYSSDIRVVVNGVLGVKDGMAPHTFTIGQNYPNPFNPTTTIRFSVAQTEHATIRVYNIIGQVVAELFNGAAQAGKYYDVTFNASALSSGVYFYQIVTPTHNEIRGMMLVR